MNLSQSIHLFSIIIPNFNGQRFIGDCLKSILQSKYTRFEVIVIDNNSTDRSLSIICEFLGDKRIKLISLKRNIHYAPANNLGIRHSKGDLLLFLNNDTRVDERWLNELINIFDEDEQIAAVQCMLPGMRGYREDSFGGTLDYSGRLIPIRYLWQKYADLRSTKRIFWGTGAALAIRKSVLNIVNGFDPDLVTDEVDLCWRINLNGGKIVLAPKAIVYHHGSASFGSRLHAQRMYYAEISMLTAILRNFGLPSLFQALLCWASFLPLAVFLDIAIRRRADVLLSRIKADYYILRNMRRLFSQRSFVQRRIRKVTDDEIKKLMLEPNPFLYWRHSQKR